MNEVQLINTIKAHIERGDKAKDKSEQHYIAAGKYLQELKDGKKQSEFLKIVQQKVGIAKSRTYELLAIADGTKTITEVRDSSATRQAKTRALRSNGQFSPRRRGRKRKNGSAPTQADIDYLMKGQCKGYRELWRDSIIESANSIIEAQAAWDKYPEPANWKKFDVTSDMVALVNQATQAWKKLTIHLKRRVK